MSYTATILADSVSPGDARLMTLEITFPRIVLAELNTHRMLSRNAASSRAIPVKKLLEEVRTNPFIPEEWGRNQSGMQAGEPLDAETSRWARQRWMSARAEAMLHAESLAAGGVHKQLANRLLEPFQWCTAIVSATEWSNFLALRTHPDAQPEIQRVAVLVREALASSTPKPLAMGEWHLPLTPDRAELDAAFDIEAIKRISAGRCARVSYLTHHGERDPQADIDLCDRLVSSGHLSPLEHVATPARIGTPAFHGNFRGWVSLRKRVPNEDDFSRR